MGYSVLTQEEQDEIVIQFLQAQERDHFCHALNRDRYAALLQTLSPGPFADRIKQLHDETVSRLDEVEAIIDKTKPQLPPSTRVVAAVTRLRVKATP